MSEFRFETAVDVRYRDLDAAGHVNNSVYATYVEQARVAYLDRVVGESLGRGEAALVSLSLTFEGPVRDPTGTVTVAVRTAALGETSLDQTYRLRHDGDRVATGEATLVAIDDDGGARPLPERWRTAIAAFEDL